MQRSWFHGYERNHVPQPGASTLWRNNRISRSQVDQGQVLIGGEMVDQSQRLRLIWWEDGAHIVGPISVSTTYKEIAHMMQDNGSTTIVIRDDVNEPTLAHSVDQVKKMLGHAVDRTVGEVQPLERALRNVDKAIATVISTAFCDNGPSTRKVMKVARDDLTSAVDELNDLYHRERVFVTYDENILAIVRDFVREVRPLITAYLAHETGAEQIELQNFLQRQNEALQALRAEIDNLPDRGRQRSEMLDLASHMAKSIKAPNHTERGLLIYQQLATIAESALSPDQYDLLHHLEEYIVTDDDGKVSVLYEMRRKLQKFISDVYRREIEKPVSEK